MAKVLMVAGNTRTQAASTTTFYFQVHGELTGDATETKVQRTYRTAGTLSNLYIRITTNDRGASTFRLRKNGADGNQVISIGASITGEFEDTSNTDAIVAGDEVCYSMVTGAGGTTFTLFIPSTVFSATTNTVIVSGSDGTTLSAASTTLYMAIAGENRAVATEANAQTEISTGGTLKNLQVNISQNARTTTTTFRSRINGANGNQVISVTASTTGIFEDTSNTDTVTANDLVCYSSVTGTGTENLVLRLTSSEF